jgi:hypothetical protein
MSPLRNGKGLVLFQPLKGICLLALHGWRFRSRSRYPFLPTLLSGPENSVTEGEILTQRSLLGSSDFLDKSFGYNGGFAELTASRSDRSNRIDLKRRRCRASSFARP